MVSLRTAGHVLALHAAPGTWADATPTRSRGPRPSPSARPVTRTGGTRFAPLTRAGAAPGRVAAAAVARAAGLGPEGSSP